MPANPTDRAPVDAVGGTQDQGPWPDDIEEIAMDERLQRPVKMSDGSVQEVEVVVTNIEQHVRPDGTETDGYTVSFQYDDPTIDGGKL